MVHPLMITSKTPWPRISRNDCVNPDFKDHANSLREVSGYCREANDTLPRFAEIVAMKLFDESG